MSDVKDRVRALLDRLPDDCTFADVQRGIAVMMWPKRDDGSLEPPQRVDPEGTTVAGTIRSEDVDCFVVTVRAGERIAAVVDGMRLDQELFDPAVEILAPDGTVVASGDDHPLLAQDALAACTAAVDGDHVVRVREAGYGGTDGSDIGVFFGFWEAGC